MNREHHGAGLQIVLTLTGLLRAIAPVIRQDNVIFSIVVLLVVWAFSSALRLGVAAARLRREFRNATSKIERSTGAVEFALYYQACAADFARNPVLGGPWRGYSQTLIMPSRPGQPVTATSDTRQWFDLPNLFRGVNSDPRYDAALPGLLVGTGLLFTFLGLAAALSAAGEVVAEGVAQTERNAALRDLLGAASVKFITSLFGLLLSILYALFRQWELRRTEVVFGRFLAALEERLPFRSAAFLQAEANQTLANLYAGVQRVGSEFFINLGRTLEREFDQGLRQHIGPLAAAIESLSEKKVDEL